MIQKLFLFFSYLLFLTITFSACNKSGSSSSGNGRISATIDGVVTDFSTDAMAFKNDPLPMSISIMGRKTSVSNSINAQLTISVNNSPSALTKGVYTDEYPGDVDIIYDITPNGNTYENICNFCANNRMGKTTVTITSVSSSNVQGTFSGFVTAYSGNVKTHTITNGSFNVPIH